MGINDSIVVISLVIILLQMYIIFMNKKKQNGELDKTIYDLVESSKDIVYFYQVKPELKFRYISPSIETVIGKGLVEESYHNPYTCFERIHPEDHQILLDKVYGNIDYSKPIIQRWKNDDGEYIWFEEFATPIVENGEIMAIQGIIRNIHDKVALQKELEYASIHDSLTGIYNRRYFERKMDEYNCHLNVPVAVILCDLDELKMINDQFGHKMGDSLITEFATLLKLVERDNIVVSRIGGDEFAILVEGMNEHEVEYLVEQIIDSVKNHNQKQRNLKIKMSLGYTCTDSSINNMIQLFVTADRNMYKDKNAKKCSQG